MRLLLDLWRRFFWAGYEFGYLCLKAFVLIITGPLFRVRRVGSEPDWPPGGAILCPNHQSYLDPPFVQLVLKRRVFFVMTNEFYVNPWGRWFFKLVGAIPVGKGRTSREGIRRAVALIRKGHAVVIFPEGRLSQDGSMGKGQRGVALVARQTNAPVFPVGIAGSIRAWPKGRRYPGRAHVRIAFGRPMQWSANPNNRMRHEELVFVERLMERIQVQHVRARRAVPLPYQVPATGSLQKA